MSVVPPQTWLCTFLRSKNQGNQLLSHLVTAAAFRFRSMYSSIMLNREPLGFCSDRMHGAQCTMRWREGRNKGAKKKQKTIVSNTRVSMHLIWDSDTCKRQTGQKSLVETEPEDYTVDFIVGIYFQLQRLATGEGFVRHSTIKGDRSTNSCNW